MIIKTNIFVKHYLFSVLLAEVSWHQVLLSVTKKPQVQDKIYSITSGHLKCTKYLLIQINVVTIVLFIQHKLIFYHQYSPKCHRLPVKMRIHKKCTTNTAFQAHLFSTTEWQKSTWWHLLSFINQSSESNKTEERMQSTKTKWFYCGTSLRCGDGECVEANWND